MHADDDADEADDRELFMLWCLLHVDVDDDDGVERPEVQDIIVFEEEGGFLLEDDNDDDKEEKGENNKEDFLLLLLLPPFTLSPPTGATGDEEQSSLFFDWLPLLTPQYPAVVDAFNADDDDGDDDGDGGDKDPEDPSPPVTTTPSSSEEHDEEVPQPLDDREAGATSVTGSSTLIWLLLFSFDDFLVWEKKMCEEYVSYCGNFKADMGKR